MATNYFKIKKGLNVESGGTASENGDISVNSNELEFHNGTAAKKVATESNTIALSNKSIDADQNTITNIENADIKAGAAIDATKIANGSVSNTEFQYLDGVTSAIQTQLNTNSTGLSDHLADTADAHAGSAITNTPSGNLAATTVQGALNELQTDVDTRATSAALASHEADTTSIHGIADTADLLTTSNSKIVTNKSIDADANTITNIDNADIKAAAAIALNKLAATTASRALVSDGSGFVTPATTTATEIGYVNGVTSAIQTQLDGKIAKTLTSTTGDMIYASSANTPARLPIGSSGQVMKVLSGVPTWASFSGGINYLNANPDAEADTSGWATYADAAAVVPVDGTGGSPNTTWTRSTSDPLRGTGSFLWTKSSGASRQGEGVSYDFVIDKADEGKPLQISFDYKLASGTFTASDGITPPANSGAATAGNSDIQVFIYGNLASGLIPVTPTVLTSNSSSSPATFKGTFQTNVGATNNNELTYRLILHTSRTTDAAMTMKFDNFYVGPQNVVSGAPVTDWTSYTPTFTGFGTVSSTDFYYRRVGSDIQVRGTTTAGTVTATTGTITLPSGLSIANLNASNQLVGRWVTNSTTANNVKDLVVLGKNGDSTVSVSFPEYTQGLSALTSQNVNALIANSLVLSFHFEVPISGWSSNVQMSNDSDTRVVAMRAQTTATTAIGAEADYLPATTLFDTHTGYSSSTGYTVPVSGTYRVRAQLITNNTSGTATIVVRLQKNGTTFSNGTNIIPSGLTGQFTCVADSIVTCVAGDILKPRMLASAGSYTLDGTAVDNYFEVQRLSGPSTIAASDTVAARYYCDASSSNLSFADAATEIADFNIKVRDTHGAVTTGANWQFKAPISGTYTVMFSLSWSNASNLSAMGIDLYKNGSIDSRVYGIVGLNNGNVLSSTGSATTTLVAGDTIDLRANQDDSASAARTIFTSSAAALNYISIIRTGN